MDPIALFRELSGPELGALRAGIPDFQKLLRDRGNVYGTRETVKVMRPKALSFSDYAELDYVCGILTGLLRRIEMRVRAEPVLMDYLGLRPEERELIAYEPLCPDPAPFTRFDSFQTADGPRFVELNGECPAGPGFVDRSLECFEAHPFLNRYLQAMKARTFSVMEGLLHGLWTVWRAAGKTGVPNVVVTDYLDLPTVGEFHIISEFLNSRGIPCVVEDPRALEYKGGRLYAKGRAIDLVYRRVLTNEFLDRRSELQAFERAYAEQAVVVINPFRSKCIHKKAAFGLLCGDLIGQDWMTSEERRVVQRTVPWTRRVREAKTDFGGMSIDLVPFVLEHKDRFVLKPNDEYGGKGVMLGWTMEADAFAAAMTEALAGDFVVQERVYTLQEPFPLMETGLEEVPMIVDLDPYVYLGRVHGVLARLAAGALCNVTSGGGQVPVVLYDPS